MAEGFSGPLEYTEFWQDKFRFRIPQGNFYFNENDCWVWIEGKRARVGVSDYVQQSLSDIIFFDAPEAGLEVEQFGALGTLESYKAVFEIIAPAACKVVAVNEDLESSSEWVNENPYEKGWIAEVELLDWESDRGGGLSRVAARRVVPSFQMGTMALEAAAEEMLSRLDENFNLDKRRGSEFDQG
ncbi:hypothetical protein JCM15765_12550 [Paradesulfitobacterium aromaticivorans]